MTDTESKEETKQLNKSDNVYSLEELEAIHNWLNSYKKKTFYQGWKEYIEEAMK